jgi:integrase/recombinase XerC
VRPISEPDRPDRDGGNAGRIAFFLEQLALAGLAPDQPVAASQAGIGAVRPDSPTVAEYVERVAPRFGDRTRRTYAPYWRLLVAAHGEHHLDELSTDDLADVVALAGRRAKENRPGSNGRSSEEAATAAIRALYRRAKAARLVVENPAAELDKPKRLPNSRRALTEDELAEVWETTARLSRDPDLDLLIVRFHVESGARQGGALALTVGDIDEDRQTLWLHEKGGKSREQAVSATLIGALLDHSRARGARRPEDPLLRFKPRKGSTTGRPLSRRRYDGLFSMLRRELPWAQRIKLSGHCLRHTAGTAIERLTSFAVARAFLGHAGGIGPTSIYTKASIHEVAAAVELLTGEPHPLATGDSRKAITVTGLTLPARTETSPVR